MEKLENSTETCLAYHTEPFTDKLSQPSLLTTSEPDTIMQTYFSYHAKPWGDKIQTLLLPTTVQLKNIHTWRTSCSMEKLVQTNKPSLLLQRRETRKHHIDVFCPTDEQSDCTTLHNNKSPVLIICTTRIYYTQKLIMYNATNLLVYASHHRLWLNKPPESSTRS